MQIVPIRDLRNTNVISERCKSSREPIFVTKNGYGDMVVMSIETYERTLAVADVYRKLMEAEHELSEGMGVDGKSAFNALRAKYE
jgi:PHD/YefM family antitoxin component YafN of YafNO toxin-antitoxin module